MPLLCSSRSFELAILDSCSFSLTCCSSFSIFPLSSFIYTSYLALVSLWARASVSAAFWNISLFRSAVSSFSLLSSSCFSGSPGAADSLDSPPSAEALSSLQRSYNFIMWSNCVLTVFSSFFYFASSSLFFSRAMRSSSIRFLILFT